MDLEVPRRAPGGRETIAHGRGFGRELVDGNHDRQPAFGVRRSQSEGLWIQGCEVDRNLRSYGRETQRETTLELEKSPGILQRLMADEHLEDLDDFLQPRQ